MVKIEYFKKPQIKIEIFDCSSDKLGVWKLFERQHYLTAKINKASRCFLACWNGVPVGFYAALAMPSGTVKNAWRGHRLVVLPDYQGLGIGNRLSEWVGDLLLSEGRRFYCKTANIKLGEYRNKSPKWKASTKNKKKLSIRDCEKDSKALINKNIYTQRICFCHEYIGNKI
jgi:GNAT superfamily N-acetyltransferase